MGIYGFKKEQRKAIVLTLMILSTMMILKIKVFNVFVLAQAMLTAGYFFVRKRICITRDFWINVIYFELILSAWMAFFSSQPSSYRKAALILLVLMVPLYFTYSLFEKWAARHPGLIETIKKGLLISLYIELCVCLLQFICWKAFSLDLNELIFTKILGAGFEVSQYKSNIGLLPSGLCWHSAFMAPVCVLAFLLTSNWMMALLAVICAFICSNSTALAGMMLCIGLTFYFKWLPELMRKKIITKKGIVLLVLALILIGGLVSIRIGLWDKIYEKLAYLMGRIFGTIQENSANVHKSYYTSLPDFLNISSWRQLLFGYGLGSSGLPVSIWTGQYASFANWSVESDLVDLLLSRGIIGCSLYYGFLFYIAYFGARLDVRYPILMCCLFIMGITYNIQFDWVFFVEMMIYLSIKCQVNFFEGKKERERKNEN